MCFAAEDADLYSNITKSDAIDDMNYILENNPIVKEKLRTIDNTNIYANSVNVYVGRPRSGKTFSAIRDIINVIRNDDNVNCLIYINDKGQLDDDTFSRFTQLITVPIIYVKYSDANEFLKNYTQYKQYYNQIVERHLQSKVPSNLQNELFQHLYISDYDKEYLHTLILCEDATNALNKCSYINDLLVRCAHTQLSFFILIHYWKALTTNIKANLSSIRIFSGYSKQQLSYMLYQMNINESFNNIYEQYRQMIDHDSLFIDCILCEHVFE
jgi:hypothetical protein